MRIRLEFKVNDLWIGAFWKVTRGSSDGSFFPVTTDVWICLLPMVPLHLTWTRMEHDYALT